MERRFADRLIEQPDCSQREAFLHAGYSPPSTQKSLYAAASKVARKPHVRAYIQMRRETLAKHRNIVQQDIVGELACVGFFDPADLYDASGALKNIHDIPIGARKSISQIEVFTEYDGRGKERKAIGQTTRIKLVDKKGALDSLARILGFFQQDKLDTDGIAQLMALIGSNKEGSTIGRISASTGIGRPVLGPVVATQQPVLDSGQGRRGGPLPSQLGATGVDGKLLVHERDPEGETVGDDDLHRHPPSG